jgi:iron only hydrogenase large subunit-like protein
MISMVCCFFPVCNVLQRNNKQVDRLLQNKRDKIMVAHVAPAVRIAIGEEMDMEPGKECVTIWASV